MKTILIVFFLSNISNGFSVIYELNETEYARMPPKFHMDEFETCLRQNGDIYCTIDFKLMSDGPSELLTMIQEYSKQTATHYNHCFLRYGLCIAQLCTGRYMINSTTVSKSQLQACLNNFFIKKYDLKTLVTKFSCNTYGVETIEKEVWDIVTLLIFCTLVFVTAIGTIVDTRYSKRKPNEYSIFLHFSLKRNWNKLKSLSDNGPDSKDKQFKGLHGVKTLIFMMVVLAHAYVPVLDITANTKPIEESYRNPLQMILLNGPIIVQIYFVISGMLLVYKIRHYEEKNKMNFRLLPKAVVMRWLRLTPPYALVILVVATLLRFTKSGPLWESSLGLDVVDCRQRGWLSLIYLNNYAYDSQCLPHTWYLAADSQLYFLGLVIYLIAKKYDARNLILSLTFFAGLFFPAIHTYIQDLDAQILINPEEGRRFFGRDPTFNAVYKKFHTNMASYVIGMTLGYIIYHLQNSNIKIDTYKKYRYIYWSLLPACFIPLYIGRIFYHDAPREPVYVRVMFAAFAKPFFGLLVAVLILGMVFKYENVYRSIFEWDRWLPFGRLSYCAFILHFLLIRIYMSTRNKLMPESSYMVALLVVGFICVSYFMAIILWLLVEAPTISLMKHYMSEKTLKNNEIRFSSTKAYLVSPGKNKLKSY